jgi:hypothetical protein
VIASASLKGGSSSIGSEEFDILPNLFGLIISVGTKKESMGLVFMNYRSS